MHEDGWHYGEVGGEDVLSRKVFPQWVIAYHEVGTHDNVIVGTPDVNLIVAW